MANKKNISKNNDQYSIKGKELQRFFDKITKLMLVPKNSANAPVPDMPALFIIMTEQDFNNAKYYNINKTIADLLDDKYPVLHIAINDKTLKAEYSIRDEESGLHFILKTLDATEPLAQFLNVTDYTEKIPIILMAQKADGSFLFDDNIETSILLFIDGYFLE